MTFALSPELPPDMLANLIVADMTPAKGDLSSEFRGYIEGMKKIEESKVLTRNDAQNIIAQYEKVRLP
jgi:hypothetical protein